MISICTYGGGTDSTADIVDMINEGEEPPYAVLFADTGKRDSEKPHTYEYVDMFSDWIQQRGWPAITWVRSPNETLEANCLRREVLPALSYGFKTCSMRWKQDPQKVWANRDLVCRAEWKAGRQVTKLIHYNADEPQRAKFSNEPRKYVNRFRLLDEDIGRDECVEIIKAAGLPLPGKSACFFCPSSTEQEIYDLSERYPALLERALFMERRALAKTKASGIASTIYGLGRRLNWNDLFEAWSSDVLVSDLSDEKPIAEPCECVD